MRRLITYLIYISLAYITISFSSCIGPGETNYLQNIKTTYSYQPFKEYKLQSGDYISCLITTGDAEFAKSFNGLMSETGRSEKSFMIYEDGNVILPYFGNVKIMGLTIQEAEQKLQEEMQYSIIDAQIHMSLSSNVFYVLSQEKRDSYSVYKENLTIYQALAISGQTADNMDLSKVTIIRKNEQGNTEPITFDLRTEEVVQSEYYYIRPNDVIYFPTNKNAFFNVTSLGSFISAITVPLSFLLWVSASKFN